MLSCDSNILFYAANPVCPEHKAATRFLDIAQSSETVICELALVELYVLHRNPSITVRAATAQQAVAAIQVLRQGPFRIVDYPGGLMSEVWWHAGQPNTAPRRIYDIRLAVTLRHFGVRRFATRNVKDFQGLGFDEVFDPIAST